MHDRRQPRVAVLLATCNGMPYLEEQVATINAQIRVDVTIIASDDMSDDGSWAWLNQQQGERLRLLPRSKAGSAGKAFVRLLCDADFAAFDYVALSDQDDLWAPRKLDRAITQMEERRCGGYSSNLVAFDENNRFWSLDKGQEAVEFDYLFQTASAGCSYVLTREAAMLVKEKLIPIKESLPLRMPHDWLIYAICCSHGVPWRLDSASHILYRQHKGNAYGARSGLRGLMLRLRMARSGWYRENILQLARVLDNTLDERAILSAVDRLNWRDRVWLSMRANEFRRRKRDRVLLIMTIVTGLFR
ncbi:MAG: glycosyltransferase [Gemmatimonadota bacterium]|nr:glycosyltransferase [Gemmatimonadota bacterium]